MHRPIEDYAIIGDLQTAALVARDGSIDWLCLPRFDSAACFAALLGTEENGHWRIGPKGAGHCTRRAYRPDTLVLDTEWDTPDGSVRVTDLMPQRARHPDVVRIVEGLSGRVTVRSSLRLRFDYGSIVPWMRRTDAQRVAVAGPDAVWLRSEPEVRSWGANFGTYAEFTVSEGERVAFVLTWHPSHEPRPEPVDPYLALANSVHDWQAWSRRCAYTGRYREVVLRSLTVLKALTYAPTGAIVAAATTSLPEQLGGVRNWDYRYSWLRDSTLALGGMLAAGYLEEAEAWRDWLLRAVAGNPAELRIMYGLSGERRIPEFELPWLRGYAHSTPVRTGNQAVEQRQLDVYGEVIDTLTLAARSGLSPKPHAWRIQLGLLKFLESSWREPDSGVWEVRGPRRNFVHSKIMSWVGADRAVRAMEANPQLQGDVNRWRRMREAVHREVCARGFDPRRNTFTQYYGSAELDAALLLIPRTGFLPPDDPRVVGTVDAVCRELSHDGLLRRYSTQATRAGTGERSAIDGLPGTEGTFLVCSFWLADALFLIGRKQEAYALFDRLVGLCNDVGLLAEEYDPGTGRQLGNFPQAFSHIGLVSTAFLLFRHTPGPEAIDDVMGGGVR